MERFLFRLAHSQHVDRFVLKGGLTTLLWAGEYGRVTRDIDLLGWGQNSVSAVSQRIGDVLDVEADDGVQFDAQSIEGAEIRVETAYVGVRVSFVADLAGMKLRMQVDVGFGDAVVPEPEWFEYPQLLDLGAPRLLGYPAEATLAEKLHAVVTLGLANSRMKDYYDLWAAHQLGIVTGEGLGMAIRHTFSRRGTPVPSELPIGLSSEFAQDRSKQAQWKGFLRKSGLQTPALTEAVEAAAELARTGFLAASEE
ncbi:MAG: nucleotidyl transferase AbiEii/AbiGii toxin family protein [Myxococcota bacterium]|nr:nucleotidyl transferase AbiEii/AbiGii toxin family protein [Myxococcota bacterium]